MTRRALESSQKFISEGKVAHGHHQTKSESSNNMVPETCGTCRHKISSQSGTVNKQRKSYIFNKTIQLKF